MYPHILTNIVLCLICGFLQIWYVKNTLSIDLVISISCMSEVEVEPLIFEEISIYFWSLVDILQWLWYIVNGESNNNVLIGEEGRRWLLLNERLLGPFSPTQEFSHAQNWFLTELILKVQLLCYCFRRPAVCNWHSITIWVFLSVTSSLFSRKHTLVCSFFKLLQRIVEK